MLQGNYQKMSTRFVTRLRARCRACGFTLVELMVTLAVAAVLAMIAVPSFRHLLLSTNLSNINNALVGDLQYARTTAVSRQVDVSVAASAGNWQNGWNVEIPAAGTAAGAVTEVLRVHPAIPVQYAVSAATTAVKYSAQGSLVPSGNETCFTIYAPSGVNNTPYFLQVLPPGMVQQTSGTATPPPTGPTCTAPPP